MYLRLVTKYSLSQRLLKVSYNFSNPHLYSESHRCANEMWIIGGDLFERITKKHRFPEESAKCVVKQLLDAVQYLHVRGIVHR